MTPAPSGSGSIRAYTAAQVRAAERPLLDAGVPLMARAAAALAAELRRMLAGRPEPWRLLVLAGSGDNGGDALYAAAELGAEGHRVRVVRTGAHVHEEALAAAVEAGAVVADAAQATTLARDCDVIVDGVIGTGSGAGAGGGSTALRGRAREVVAALVPLTARGHDAAGGTGGDGAPRHPLVVAVDLPSGIDPDTGAADAAVLPADSTVTFGGLKAGLVTGRGRELAGRVIVVDIGLADALAAVTPAFTVPATDLTGPTPATDLETPC